MFEKYTLKISHDHIEYLKKASMYFTEDITSYLLKHSNVQYNIMEKIVYDIANFHLLNKNIKLNKSHFIEFGIHKKGDTLFKTQQMNIEGNIVTPIFSSILHLTNNNPLEPVVYTNITTEEYMFKEFSDTSLHVSFPEKNKQIVFDGKMYYSSNLSNDVTLTITIWDTFPVAITYFDNIICDFILYKNTKDELFNKDKTIVNRHSDSLVKIERDISGITVIGSWGIITEQFLEKIIYNKTENDIQVYDSLFNLIKKNTVSDILFKQNSNEIETTEAREVLEAMEAIEQSKVTESRQNRTKRININEDKYIQRPIIYNKFQKEICDWIIREIEKYALSCEGWVIQNRTKQLQADKVTTIFSFILDSFIESIHSICDCYSINKDAHTFHIENIYISKLDHTSENANECLFYQKHDSDIVLNIALNDDFENGGILFNDNITTYLKKGNMLIFNGNTKYSEYDISRGIKYNLIANINIQEKM
jgi:hypothetical protein